MFYSFYNSSRVPSVSYLVYEMGESEVKSDHDPDRNYRVAAETIVKLMLDTVVKGCVIIGVNADGKNEVLATSKDAEESWDYVLIINQNYFSVSVKANAQRKASVALFEERWANSIHDRKMFKQEWD